MEKSTLGANEQASEELSYAEQAKLVNAQITGAEKAIFALLRKANSEGKDMYEIREKYIARLELIIKGIG